VLLRRCYHHTHVQTDCRNNLRQHNTFSSRSTFAKNLFAQLMCPGFFHAWANKCWLQHGARVIAVETHTRTPPHDPSELHGYFLKCSSFLLARMLSALNVATHALVKVLKEVAAKFGVKLKLTRDNTCPM